MRIIHNCKHQNSHRLKPGSITRNKVIGGNQDSKTCKLRLETHDYNLRNLYQNATGYIKTDTGHLDNIRKHSNDRTGVVTRLESKQRHMSMKTKKHMEEIKTKRENSVLLLCAGKMQLVMLAKNTEAISPEGILKSYFVCLCGAFIHHTSPCVSYYRNDNILD